MEKTVLRAEVKWFAEEMENTLKKNDHKGGWGPDKCDMDYLINRLEEEVNELTDAFMYSSPDIKEKIISECADVANFAMMIADRIRKMD